MSMGTDQRKLIFALKRKFVTKKKTKPELKKETLALKHFCLKKLYWHWNNDLALNKVTQKNKTTIWKITFLQFNLFFSDRLFLQCLFFSLIVFSFNFLSLFYRRKKEGFYGLKQWAWNLHILHTEGEASPSPETTCVSTLVADLWWLQQISLELPNHRLVSLWHCFFT